ncbi:Sensor protein FixL [Martelella mediterranea DSM 17316]|uniref:histidine kinase n=1 Tax=Martelella mediterranea DSM 17316 TaxID=1122214 RepID=A0A1U9Z3F8_9HYPH|nr:Sensor protein FixL [Martelella mediterranea DSM 17316]
MIRLTRQEPGRYDLLFRGAAILIAASVFTIDTFTEIEGAIAVLYSIALLLAAQSVERTGLKFFSALFLCMALISFTFTHAAKADFPTYMRLGVALISLGLTTALLLRNDRARAELLRINAALALSEARYRSIFDRTRVALWERDYSKLRAHLLEMSARGVTDIKSYARQNPDFVNECIGMIDVVASNQAAHELLGTRDDSSLARTGSHFIPMGDDTFASVLQAIVDGDTYFEGNAEIMTESGERKHVLVSISFPTDVEAFDRVVVGMIDITQREEARLALAAAKEELSHATRAATIGALSASLAHELNQPLGAIAVNAQTLTRWLDRDPPDVEAAKRSAERILRDSSRGSDILKSTRLMLSDMPRQPEVVALAKLIDDTLELMKHDLQAENVSVEVVQKRAIPPISVVRLELQQVLINLISNAIQAIAAAEPDRRVVTITLDTVDDMISLIVCDTGDGLDEAARAKLFTPFFTTKSSGMGIGLSISRSTIEAMGGSIEGSNHPDGGAMFEIRLPGEREDA